MYIHKHVGYELYHVIELHQVDSNSLSCFVSFVSSLLTKFWAMDSSKLAAIREGEVRSCGRWLVGCEQYVVQ